MEIGNFLAPLFDCSACHCCRKKVSAAASTRWFEKKRNNSRWHWSTLTSPHWTRPLNADEVQRVAERQVSLLNWIFRKELRSTWRTLNEILWIMQNIWQAFSLRHASTRHLIEMLTRTWAWIDAVSLSIARLTQSKSFDYDPVYFSATTFWKFPKLKGFWIFAVYRGINSEKLWRWRVLYCWNDLQFWVCNWRCLKMWS